MSLAQKRHRLVRIGYHMLMRVSTSNIAIRNHGRGNDGKPGNRC